MPLQDDREDVCACRFQPEALTRPGRQHSGGSSGAAAAAASSKFANEKFSTNATAFPSFYPRTNLAAQARCCAVLHRLLPPASSFFCSAGQLLAFSKVLTSIMYWHLPSYFLASFCDFIAANISAASPFGAAGLACCCSKQTETQNGQIDKTRRKRDTISVLRCSIDIRDSDVGRGGLPSWLASWRRPAGWRRSPRRRF